MRFDELVPFDISSVRSVNAMLLYYITDRSQFEGTEAERRVRLLAKIAEAAAAGVNMIQLRERDLPTPQLEALAADALAAVRLAGSNTRLLINSRTDVALAVGADGVHLRSDDVSAADARAVAASRPAFTVGVSCHTVEEVRSAWSQGADFAVFAPVFEKNGRPGAGLAALKQACQVAPHFVIALGGVTRQNARSCVTIGAGIGGIRLYQQGDISTLVGYLAEAETGRPEKG